MALGREWILFLVLGGCASIANVQTADTLGKGRLQIAIEPGAWIAANSSTASTVPRVDAAIRYGVGESFDLGLRVGSTFVEIQGKFQLLRTARWSIAFGPTLGGIASGVVSPAANGGKLAGGMLNVVAPVMFGLHLAPWGQFIIGARVQGLINFGTTNTIAMLGLGASMGFAIRAHNRLTLVPEVAVLGPIVAGGDMRSVFSDVFPGIGTPVILQLSLGFLLGAQ